MNPISPKKHSFAIMVGNYQDAKQYAIGIADNLTKINLMEFFGNVHDQFYPEMDVSFMEYFLEIAGHDGEFVVPHSKLREYGIMTSTQSNDVRVKLNGLGLTKEEDYQRRDVSELRKQGGTSVAKHYTLTPKAFKKCLMRAQRRANQPVDPVIYVDYYLLLEDIFKLYGMYQDCYSKRVLSMKDDKIDNLSAKIDAQSQQMKVQNQQMKVQSQQIDDQSEQIAELLGYAKETKETLDEVQDDLTETKEEVKIAKTYLVEKSKDSTRKTKSEQKHHLFVATTIDLLDGWRKVTLTTGTKKHVETKVAKLISEAGHQIAIPAFYNANGFDLRNNCRDEFVKFRKQRLIETNKRNAEENFKFNEPLKVEIRAHNRNHPGNKRSFPNEKRKTKNVKSKDIDAEFNVTWFKHRDNPYISFDEMLKIIIDMNAATQKSPLADEE